MKTSRLRRKMDEQDVREIDVNPLENMANLSDVMLVLAVGILCALLIYWNIDPGEKGRIQMNEIELQDQEQIDQTDLVDVTDKDLKEYGKVYSDEEGNLYIQADGTD